MKEKKMFLGVNFLCQNLELKFKSSVMVGCFWQPLELYYQSGINSAISLQRTNWFGVHDKSGDFSDLPSQQIWIQQHTIEMWQNDIIIST